MTNKKFFSNLWALCILLNLLTISPAWSAEPDFLAARSWSQEQYLARIPAVFRNLYGPMAMPAAELLWKNAGPVFAADAMVRAYGEIWALSGPINLKERSLATVSALVAQKLFPQIRLHLNGFLSSGGTLEELYELVALVANQGGAKMQDGLIDAVVSGLQWRADSMKGFAAPTKEQVKKALGTPTAALHLKLEQRQLALLATHIALGNIDKIHDEMHRLMQTLPPAINKDQYLDLLITHLIVYCGYPRGMNAFNVWQKMRGEFTLH